MAKLGFTKVQALIFLTGGWHRHFFKLPRATMSVFRGWLSLSLPAVTCRSSGVRLCKCRFLAGTMPTTDVSDQSQWLPLLSAPSNPLSWLWNWFISASCNPIYPPLFVPRPAPALCNSSRLQVPVIIVVHAKTSSFSKISVGNGDKWIGYRGKRERLPRGLPELVPGSKLLVLLWQSLLSVLASENSHGSRGSEAKLAKFDAVSAKLRGIASQRPAARAWWQDPIQCWQENCLQLASTL